MAIPFPIATDTVMARASVRALPTDQTGTDQIVAIVTKKGISRENGIEITANDEKKRNPSSQ